MDEKLNVTKKDGRSPLSTMDNTTRAFVAEMTDDRELLFKLIHDDYWTVASAAADNPSFDSKKLDSLARDSSEHVSVRVAVAQSDHASEDTLRFLVEDNSPDARFAVARNKNTNAETLALMVKDEDHLIRLAVARHENATAEILSVLMKDKVPFIREAVAYNKNTTAKILSILMKDNDPYIRRIAFYALVGSEG